MGELTPCSGRSMAKGIRTPTPHHTTSRAAAPMDMVHIDTAGPFQESLEGSRYVVMFVGSSSRFQRSYGTRDKSESSILGVVKRSWEFREHLGPTTAPSTPTRRSLITVTSRNPPRTNGAIYAATERLSGERTLESDQGGARGTT